jgi:hypothetical protein
MSRKSWFWVEVTFLAVIVAVSTSTLATGHLSGLAQAGAIIWVASAAVRLAQLAWSLLRNGFEATAEDVVRRGEVVYQPRSYLIGVGIWAIAGVALAYYVAFVNH